MKTEDTNIRQSSAGTEEPVKSPEKRRRKLLLLVFLFVILFSAVLIIGAAAASFSEHKSIPQQPLRHEDMILQQKLIRRLSKEVFSSRPRQESQIELTTGEMESLFRMIDFGCTAAKLAGKYNGLEPRYFEPVFFSDRLQAVYPLDTGWKWLFGGVLRCEITATPEFSNKILTVDVHDCRLGIIPLPSGIVENFLLSALEQLYASKDYKIFCSMIKEIYMKSDGRLVIVYHPAKLLPLLTF